MGLDSGIVVKSNIRQITRSDLPTTLRYPFEKDYSDGVEICYARKYWGMRSQILREINWSDIDGDYYFYIINPKEIIHLIEVVASWLDEKRWDAEGSSIWEYDEARPNLIDWIVNLAIIYKYMITNTDVYLIYYDSY